MIIPLIKEILKYLLDIKEKIWFFFDRHFEIKDIDNIIPKGLSKEDIINLFVKFQNKISNISDFNRMKMEQFLRELQQDTGLKTKQLFMPLRIAITGTKVSPGLFETMEVLGKKRIINRLSMAIETLKKSE